MDHKLLKAKIVNYWTSPKIVSALRHGLAYLCSAALCLMSWKILNFELTVLTILSAMLFIEYAIAPNYTKRVAQLVGCGIITSIPICLIPLIPANIVPESIALFVIAYAAYYCFKFAPLGPAVALMMIVMAIVNIMHSGHPELVLGDIISLSVGILIAFISMSIFVPTEPKIKKDKASNKIKLYLMCQVRDTLHSIQNGKFRKGFHRTIIEGLLEPFEMNSETVVERFTKNLDKIANSLHTIRHTKLYPTLKQNVLTTYEQVHDYLHGSDVDLEKAFNAFLKSFKPIQPDIPKTFSLDERIQMAEASFAVQCLCLDAPEIKELMHAKV